MIIRCLVLNEKKLNILTFIWIAKHPNETLIFSLFNTSIKYIYFLLYKYPFIIFLSVFFVLCIFQLSIYFSIAYENYKQNKTCGECSIIGLSFWIYNYEQNYLAYQTPNFVILFSGPYCFMSISFNNFT